MSRADERLVVFHSQFMGVKLHRKVDDGTIRVLSVSSAGRANMTPAAVREGDIRMGDVVCEILGLNLRNESLTKPQWLEIVARLKTAPRPLMMVVRNDLNYNGTAAAKLDPFQVGQSSRGLLARRNNISSQKSETVSTKNASRSRSLTPPRSIFKSLVTSGSISKEGTSKSGSKGNSKSTGKISEAKKYFSMGTACLVPEGLPFHTDKPANGKQQPQNQWMDSEGASTRGLETQIYCGDLNAMMLVSQISLDPYLLDDEEQNNLEDDSEQDGFEVVRNDYDASFASLVNRHVTYDDGSNIYEHYPFYDERPFLNPHGQDKSLSPAGLKSSVRRISF